MRETSLLHSHLGATYRPCAGSLQYIDEKRHPNVCKWASYNGSGAEAYNYASLGWLTGYLKYGDVFERAAYLTPDSPSNSFADAWNLVGLRADDFSATTINYYTITLRGRGTVLPHHIATHLNLGDVPENFFDQNQWARGQRTSFRDVVHSWSSYPEALVGGMARTWEPDNIDELMAYNIKFRDVKALVELIYPEKEYEKFASKVTVPFEAVRAGLIEKTPVEYLKAMV